MHATQTIHDLTLADSDAAGWDNRRGDFCVRINLVQIWPWFATNNAVAVLYRLCLWRSRHTDCSHPLTTQLIQHGLSLYSSSHFSFLSGHRCWTYQRVLDTAGLSRDACILLGETLMMSLIRPRMQKNKSISNTKCAYMWSPHYLSDENEICSITTLC